MQQLLLTSRESSRFFLKTKPPTLNTKTYDGITPMILASRLAIEGMVEDLIQKDADINASDENGKSALHWAATINNVDAVKTLLAHGANRDAQDSKDETPLFLACREGSYQAAKELLDHCANRDIPDHMDRGPRDVAQERLHHEKSPCCRTIFLEPNSPRSAIPC